MVKKQKKIIHYEGVGRRKVTVARVRLIPGKGRILVNKKPLEEYFNAQTYSRNSNDKRKMY